MTAIAIKGAKKGQNKPRRPSIAKDSVASTSTAKLLYGLAEGEVYGLVDGGKSIRLDGTPLLDDNGHANFEGVTWDFRHGTNEQEYIKGFPDVSNETGIGVELKSSQPWVKAFTDTQLSAVRVRFKWNRLSKTNPDNGDVTGYKIDYAIDLQTDGGAYQEVLKTKIEDKTSAGYERTHRIDLPKATTGWQIRVRRLTPNDPSEYVQDTMMIDAVAEVIDVKLRYPNTALLGVQYNAETFGSIAKLEAHVRGSIIRVPANYDPVARTYNGIWDGTFKDAYSNNPAWVYYDLCRQWRYGLGDRLDATMIDKWSLYTLGQYCDEMVSDGQGGLEPRFTCNVYLQKQADAYKVLQNIAGIFRGMSYWNGEKIFADADVPQDPVYTFSRANVIDGQFEYTGTRARDRHTLAKVAWDNPLNSYQTEYEYVRDEKAMAKLGVKVLELNAFGCTSQAQAQRAGLWALKTEQLETRQVSFGAGLDAVKNITVGNIINVSDELFAGRANGGRVSTVNDTQRIIELDREVVAAAGDVLIINGGNGKSERRNISHVNGNRITVTAGFTGAEPEHVWAIETADLKLMRFRVMSITQNDDVTFNITAIQHEPQKYDAVDFGTDVKPTEITIINPETVDAPASVTITSRHRVVQGQTVTTLVIGWAQVPAAVAYDVEWRKDDGTWVKVPRTGNVSVEIEGVYSGNYMARVRSVSAFDVQSQATTSVLTAVEGKVGLPPTVVGLTATGVLFGMDLKWGFQAGSGDADYTEIQVGSAPNVNVATLGQYSYPTNTHTINGLQGNLSQSYRARLVDKLGFKSPWSAWVTGTTDADANKILDIIDGEIKQSHLYNELSSKIDKVDEIQPIRDALGSSDDPNSVLGQLKDAKDRFGDDEKLLNAMEQAIKAESAAEFKSFKDLVDEDGRLGGIIERDLGENQDGLVFGKLEGVFAQIGDEKMAGDDDRWAGDNSYYAGVWSLQSAMIEGDTAQAQRIDGVASQVNDNQAQILEVSRTSASENEVTARKLTSLSAQLVGGSESSDLNNITSGLIFDEMSLRIREDDALAERISMLSVGVGESFDPFKIWHFDDDAEGWTGGIYTAGVLEARTDALVSPALIVDTVDDDGQPLTEQISTTRYHHLKMRVTKVGSPTWLGGVSWSGGSLGIGEPIWTAEGDTVVSVDLAWTGTVTDFSITLASTADADNYYKIDWIAVGSPSPAASSAQLSRIDRVNASRYHSAAQAITFLDSEVNGENGEKSLAQIRSEFNTVSSNASSAADAIDLLSTQYSTDLVTFYGDVLGESNSLSSELGTVATQLDGVFAQVTTRWSGDGIESERWAGDDRPDDAVGVWSERSATIEGDLYLAEQIDGLAAQVGSNNASILNEQVARVRGNTALAAEQRQLSTVVGNNTADILLLSIAVTNPESGLAAQVTQLQSQTEQAVILAGNKGEIIYSYGQPPVEKQLEQNLWFKIDGDATTPHVWDKAASKWVALTDKEAANAKADAAEALSAAQSAQGIADSKGEVIYGSTQPNVLKRLPQNLWIDTRNGVNTPKRWINGDWREVTDKVAKDAAGAASEAQGAASAAQAAADLAQEAADLALGDLEDIYSDGKVTPSEKKQIKTIWTEIVETDVEVRANAAKYGVGLGTYPEAYTNLENLINTLWLDNNTTANVDRTTIDSRFEIYYRRRAIINRNIVTAAEQATANAQGSAEAAASAASAAKGAADEADRKARVAQGQVNDISADGKLTPVEKKQAKLIWSEIARTDTEVRANAAKYKVSITTYSSAYTALDTYLKGLITGAEANTTSIIDRAAFDKAFADVYAARAEVNKLIVVAAEKQAADAQGAADAAQGVASSALGAAQAAQGAADAAEGKAQKAKEDLSDIYSDGKITPSEKQQIKTIWTEIVETDVEVRANATKYEVNLGTYPAAYTALENYVDWLLLDMSTTTGVNRNDMDSRFEIYYRRRAAINRDIVSAAEKQASEAQSTANNKGENIYSTTAPSVDKQLPQNIWYKIEGNVVTAHAWSNGKWTPIVDKGAADAKTAAEAAEGKAQEAKDDLSDIYSDGKVTPSEKQQIKTIWTEIVETDAEVRANAAKYGVPLGTYPNAYTNLENLVGNLLLDMNATTGVNRTTLDGRFEIYYRRRAAVNRDIVTAAEKQAADAKAAADNKGESIYSTTEPVAAKRLTQNVWYKIEGNTVTAHRWNGTEWKPLVDTLADKAQRTADGKGEVIYSATAPSADKRAAANVWYKPENGTVTAYAWSNGAWTPLIDRLATQANSAVVDMADDDKLTPVEKQQTALIVDDIKKADTDIKARANQYNVSTASYVLVYDALIDYINPLLLNTKVTSDIVRTDFTGYFSDLYAARAQLDIDIGIAVKLLADNKGEVIYSNTAPVANKRKTQNLWVDTTGGKNVFKRWNGSAWVVATDQTAVDLAKNKGEVIYSATQPSADKQLPQNIWYKQETVSGKDVVTPHVWSGGKWTPLTDKGVVDAVDIANSKGEIIYSDTAPPASKRNPQNLWIHTGENNGNTPKMWSSAQSKWVIVSDQKAIDALEKANDTRTNLATYVEESGAFSNEFGAISGNITTLQRRQNGQTDSIEIVAALGDAEKLKNEIAKARLDKDVDALNEKDAKLEALIAEYNASRADAVAKRNAAPADVRPVYQQIIVSIDEAKADVNAQRAAIAAQVSQLISEKAELDSLVQTESDVKAQYFVKFDVNNRAAGFGMMQNANATVDFAVLADKFYIASPDATSKGITPFYVQTTTQNGRPAGTYIRDAFVGTAAITTAKINDAAITTAKIGNLQVDTAQIANGAIETAKIANLAVKSAQIDNLAVTKGKIANLAVDTLQIAGNAVTIPLSSFTQADTGSFGGTRDIQQITIPATEGRTAITFSASYFGSSERLRELTLAGEFMFTLDGVIVLNLITAVRGKGDFYGTTSFSWLLPAGAKGVLKVVGYANGGTMSFGNRFLSATVHKR